MRLTAPDGYTASRSYSVASPPDGGDEIELTVERLDDGEVSTFLHDVVEVGDELEVRGPIGGCFVWDGDTPALLVGGGSGVVPLMAMLRLARAPPVATISCTSSCRCASPDDLYYADELPGRDDATVVYTRADAAGRRPGPPDGSPRDDVEPHLRDDADRLRVRLGAVHRRGRRPGRRPRRARRAGRVERFGPSG